MKEGIKVNYFGAEPSQANDVLTEHLGHKLKRLEYKIKHLEQKIRLCDEMMRQDVAIQNYATQRLKSLSR